MPRAIANRPNAADTRTLLRLSSGLGALAMVALAQPAFAADECGVAVGGTVTCAAGVYAGGVTYVAASPLTVVLNADTAITPIAGTSGVTVTGNQAQTLTAAAGSTITTNAAPAVSLITTTAPIIATTGTIRTTGANAPGVLTSSTSGSTTITARDTATTGLASSGIDASTTTGALTITSGTISTTGDGSFGVDAASTDGNILINGGTVTTAGANAPGLAAQAAGTGSATIQGGTVTTTGPNSVGVAAVTSGTGAAVATPLSVTTTGANSPALAAVSSGGTAQAGAANTTVSTTGLGSVGILARGLTGTTVNYASVSTTGANATGILVPAGGASVTVNGATNGLLSTTGAAADGINVEATNAATVNVGRVSATGLGSRGIVATGGTTANVTSTGVVANGDAVTATSGTGAANVALSGTNNSVTGTGAVVNGGTTAGLTLASGGTLNGAVNGATLTSATGATVTNSGTISGTNAAIQVLGAGPATITNNASGTINGRILLGAGNDTVTNAGTFNGTAVSDFGAGNDTLTNSGTFNANAVNTFGAGNDTVNNSGTFNLNAAQDFGVGTDVFNNTGTLRVLPTSGVAGTVTLTGLETFNNSGSIDLRNGHTGDVLALPGTFNGTGASSLTVDANLGTAPATTDRLTVAGAATGSTAVTINRIDAGPAVLSNATGLTIVTTGAGSSANAFVIDPASQNAGGIIQYGVVFNPGTNTFNLVSAPGAAAYRTSLFGDGVRNLWLQSGDAWSAHMRELRDNIAANGPGGAGGRFWFQGYGQNERRNNGSTYTFNGITTAVDLGYDQDYYGFQMGMDLGAPVGDEGGFNFGVTGGYQNSTMSFRNTADRIKFNSVNGGVYASFTSGIFFVNALGKYDYYWGENISPAGNYRSDVNGSVWGAKAEAGLRFGQDFFIEPAVSVSWTNSDFDDLGLVSGNFAIDDDDGVRGKAGARFGYVTDAGSARLTLYGGVNYVHEFRGRSNVVFTSGGQTVAFRSPYNNDYVEGTLGVNIGSQAGRVSGFFEGRYGEGNDYRGYGARGGMRVRF